MDKFVANAIVSAISGNGWKKFIRPTVHFGKTVFPKFGPDQERLGIRWDYDGEFTDKIGTVYNRFKMQPNAGKIPSTIKNWRDKNGGTHAVMATVYVKKDGTKEDAEAGLKAVIGTIQGV